MLVQFSDEEGAYPADPFDAVLDALRLRTESARLHVLAGKHPVQVLVMRLGCRLVS